MDIPNKYQYDVVSVMADIPRDPLTRTFNLRQREAMSKLKKLGTETLVTVVYAGLRIAPSITKYYCEKTFIIQGREEIQRKTYLGEYNSTNFLSNIDLTINQRLNML